MKPHGRKGRSEQDSDGTNAPLPAADGLVRLRRQADWSDEPRPGDEAAEAAYRAALAMATATLVEHDGGTAAHSDDVVTLTLALAEEMGVQDRDRAYLLAAAELHDIGKVGVPPHVLSKAGPLDEAEWGAIREHTVTGERILGAVPELREVARIVRHCHERWDGEGYPDGLREEQIPLLARIVFCADAYHAIRGDRPYRRGRSARAALAEVERHSGTQFDPVVVAALSRVATRVRERRAFGLPPIFAGHRSQRLAALLLTLAISGSAFAATGVWNPTGGEASDNVEESPPAQKPPGDESPAGKAVDGDDMDRKPTRETRSDQRGGATGASETALGSPATTGARGSKKRLSQDGAEPVRREPSGAEGGAPRRIHRTEDRSPKRAPRPAPAPPAAQAPAPAPPPAPAPAPAPVPPPAPPADDDDDGGHHGDDGDDGDDGNGHDGHDGASHHGGSHARGRGRGRGRE